MTTETNTTDFDTVRKALPQVHKPFHNDDSPAHEPKRALARIEASHAALVAQRDAAVTILYRILTHDESMIMTSHRIEAEAAVALSKGAK